MPRALEVDQQEEPLLTRASSPDTPPTTALNNAYSNGASNGQTPSRQHQLSSLTLPPAAASPGKRPPHLPTSASSSTRAHSCCRPLPLLVHCLLVCLILASLHYLSFSFQHTQLRCTVLAASHLLSLTSSPAHWWWDFGTLLGLTREHDIIFTEVDADLSVTWQQRNRIWQQWNDPHSSMQTTWRQYGFTVMEQRGAADHPQAQDVKLRLYSSWGWYLDIDVWDEVPANASLWQWPTAPSPDRLDSDPSVSMQMITGRLEPEQYVLPSTLIYPLTSLPSPSHWLSVCPDVAALLPGSPSVQVPYDTESVLQHWYGSGWREPRKFDKGRDASSDRFELWMWQHLVRVYELLWAGKVVARAAHNGLQHHTLLVAYYTVTVTVAAAAIMRAGYTWQRRHAWHASPSSSAWRRQLDSLSLSLSPVLCTIAYVFVLWVVLFIAEYSWYVYLGWGMWRAALIGLALPVVGFRVLVSKAASDDAVAHQQRSSKQNGIV